MLVIDVFISSMGNGKSIPLLIMFLSEFLSALHEAVVLYQLISVWNSKRSVAWLMASGFIIMHSTTIVFVAVTISEFKGMFTFVSCIYYSSSFNFCFQGKSTSYQSVLSVYATLLSSLGDSLGSTLQRYTFNPFQNLLILMHYEL